MQRAILKQESSTWCRIAQSLTVISSADASPFVTLIDSKLDEYDELSFKTDLFDAHIHAYLLDICDILDERKMCDDLGRRISSTLRKWWLFDGLLEHYRATFNTSLHAHHTFKQRCVRDDSIFICATVTSLPMPYIYVSDRMIPKSFDLCSDAVNVVIDTHLFSVCCLGLDTEFAYRTLHVVTRDLLVDLGFSFAANRLNRNDESAAVFIEALVNVLHVDILLRSMQTVLGSQMSSEQFLRARQPAEVPVIEAFELDVSSDHHVDLLFKGLVARCIVWLKNGMLIVPDATVHRRALKLLRLLVRRMEQKKLLPPGSHVTFCRHNDIRGALEPLRLVEYKTMVAFFQTVQKLCDQLAEVWSDTYEHVEETLHRAESSSTLERDAVEGDAGEGDAGEGIERDTVKGDDAWPHSAKRARKKSKRRRQRQISLRFRRVRFFLRFRLHLIALRRSMLLASSRKKHLRSALIRFLRSKCRDFVRFQVLAMRARAVHDNHFVADKNEQSNEWSRVQTDVESMMRDLAAMSLCDGLQQRV